MMLQIMFEFIQMVNGTFLSHSVILSKAPCYKYINIEVQNF